MDKLTSEQRAVVYHPIGKHARVLAVAGSGKTTTMVHRVKHLVQDQQISPRRICILMFNKRARVQFQERLAQELAAPYRPEVHTFHSFSYKLISLASQMSLLPSIQNAWVGDKEELVRINVHKAIKELAGREEIAPDSIDPDDAIDAIGLWKGSLIPPDRAGHISIPALALVYKEFENLRLNQGAITFDDFVPLAVDILEAEPAIGREFAGTFDTVIVDEYQDVNYGQQQLIEIIAGSRADIMVVGDDDQTIYEWRGARPSYIVKDFSSTFRNKPSVDYKLSRTFRFGPVIAQCAQNVIRFNSGRIQKALIAHRSELEGKIHLCVDSSEQPTDVDKELANQVFALVREHNDPKNIIVLARMFSQLVGLEAAFLAQNIPYRVIGRSPFFERREITVLLDYFKLALSLDDEINQASLNLLLSVANVPNRKLSRDTLTRAFKSRASFDSTPREVMEFLSESFETPLTQQQRQKFYELASILIRLNERIMNEPGLNAGKLLQWLISTLDYFSHFDSYYGNGEQSADRKQSVSAFCIYAQGLTLNVHAFLKHIAALDTTRGVPEDEQIVMTTIFRVKGEEFDYVIIPNCNENSMPCLLENGNDIYDKSGTIHQSAPSTVLESERRLFYVAITRARKAVFIGASSHPKRGSQSSSGQPLPSRFIYEAELDITEILMATLQRVAVGDLGKQAELQGLMERYAGRKHIIDNLLREYLPFLKVSLSVEAQHTILNTPAVTFAYPRSFENNDKPSEPLPSRERKWWEDDTSISKYDDIPF